jgi:hypothetical protein
MGFGARSEDYLHTDMQYFLHSTCSLLPLFAFVEVPLCVQFVIFSRHVTNVLIQ